MDQFLNALKIYKALWLPSSVRNVSDPFARELVYLWYKYNRKGRCYVAWSREEGLVGFILLEHNSRKLKTIRGTWVDSRFRNRGIGKALMQFVLHEYEYNPADIKVNVTKGAEEFYEKQGFMTIGHRDDFNMDIMVYNRHERSKNTIQH